MGIATHSSPLLKASFETTASFISDATLYGDFDDLTSPSGSIVVGRPAKMGTGSFDVLADFDVRDPLRKGGRESILPVTVHPQAEPSEMEQGEKNETRDGEVER